MIAKVLGYQGIPTTTLYVVPQMLPCRHCKGSGVDIDCECMFCDESGVVAPPWPDYIATPGWRGFDPHHRPPFGPWRPMPESIDDGVWVGRQDGQVVAYKVTTIDPLPVVDDPYEAFSGVVLVAVDGPHRSVSVDGEYIDEPWAADLTPGHVVWRLHLEALDRPYTEMVCPCGGQTACYSCAGRAVAVPLSVPVGEVVEMELAP